MFGAHSLSRIGTGIRRSKVLHSLLYATSLFLISSQAHPVPVYPIAESSGLSNGSHAYATRETTPVYNNVTPLSRLHLRKLDSSAAIQSEVATMLSSLNSLPAGTKGILNVDLDFLEIAQGTAISFDGSKPITVALPSGQLLPDAGIWLEPGIDEVKSRVDAFFKQYQAQGGQLDFVVLDYSGILLTADVIEKNANQSGLSSLDEYLSLIESHADFPSLAAQLGFSDLSLMYDGTTQSIEHRQRWDAVMKDRVAAYLQDAFYNPIASYFPQSIVSATDFYAHQINFPVADPAYGQQPRSNVVGNKQNIRLSNEGDAFDVDGIQFKATAFNVLRKRLDDIKGASFSDQQALIPTILNKASDSSVLSGSDYYQEWLFHAGLIGAREFVYQNANSSAVDDGLVDKTLAEFKQYVGTTAFQPLSDAFNDWTQSYVLTGVSTDAGNIWRFTPDMSSLGVQSINDLIVSYSPASFQLGNQQIVIPDAEIHTAAETVSSSGFWLKGNVGLADVSCADYSQSNTECTAYFASNNLADAPSVIVLRSGIGSQMNRQPINADWGDLGAGFGAGKDQFSVRSLATYDMVGGDYQVSLATKDDAKVWLNDALIIDAASSDGNDSYAQTVSLKAGSHVLKTEYVDESGAAALNLSLNQLSCVASDGVDCSMLFDASGRLLSNGMKVTKSANGLSFKLDDLDLPENLDGLTLEWEGLFSFKALPYLFNLKHGNGSLDIFLDDAVLYSAKQAKGDISEEVIRSMTAGMHRVKVVYQLTEGSYLDIDWQESKNSCADVPENAFCAEFYKGMKLEGLPIHSRIDDKIDFYWRGASPEPEFVPKDRFSVRWQGDFEFTEGTYRFISSTDDGIRVLVDGEEVISSWKYQGTTEYFNDIDLTAGKHRIVVEYFEGGGWATAKLRWEKMADCSGIPDNQFCGSYYNAQKSSFSGDPVRTYLVDNIDFEKEKNQAPLHGVRHYKYSVRWEGNFDFAKTGLYQFNIDADDGLRIYVDDKLISDSWSSRRWPFYGKDQRVVEIDQGKHHVVVEYYQAWSKAKAKVSWNHVEECTGDVKDAFCISLYETKQLDNRNDVRAIPRYVQKVEGAVNNEWNYNKPAELIWKNNFSAKWQGKHYFKKGSYRFTTSTDDGTRLYVDGVLAIDKWRYQGERAYHKILDLDEGYHDIRMEYFEGGGKATARLRWEGVDSCENLPEGKFCETFYNNRGLSGEPVDIRVVDNVDYDFGRGVSPTPYVNNYHYSARWVTKQFFKKGNYRFTTSTDEGVRLYINGEPVINKWRWQRETAYNKIVELDEGIHEIKMEYFQGGGNAIARLKWAEVASCENVPEGQLCETFYNSHNLSGEAANIRHTEAIDYDWKGNAPADFVRKDRFSTRWTKTQHFDAGVYRFFMKDVDDGVRILVDGEKVLDVWNRRWPLYGNRQALWKATESKTYTVEVQYYDNWGAAKTNVQWEAAADCSVTPEDKFCTEIFANRNLSGKAIDARYFDKIDSNWQHGQPTHGVWKDNFSTRSIGQFNFEGGYYNFNVNVNDGMRVWLDDKLIVDNWRWNWHWKGRENRVVEVPKGQHTIRVETYERYGQADAKLTWSHVEGCDDTPENAFCMEVFDTKALDANGSKLPKFMSKVDKVDENWGYDQPHELIWKDNFSARWKGKHEFEKGIYRFTTSTSDGARLYIDDKLVVDKWRHQGETVHHALVEMDAGWHDVRMEYFEGSGLATANLEWSKQLSCADVPDNHFCAEYFNNREMSGMAQDIEATPTIEYDWGHEAPMPNVGRDKFSVRFSGQFDFEGGLYRFASKDVDDGFRVKVDGKVVLDAWHRKWPWYGSQRVLKEIEPGKHDVVVEYREEWGRAKVNVFWEKAPDCSAEVPNGKFCASFYNNRNLEGEPVDNRIDDEINYEWFTKSPHPNVYWDNFSARWSGDFNLAEGEYTFNIRTDDGHRLLINDETVVDSWGYGKADLYSKRIYLPAGTHRIVSEYFEAGGWAIAQLNWVPEQVNVPATPTNLQVIENSESGVTLTWDGQPLTNKFNIYRDGALLATVQDVAAFTDNSVEVTKAYQYEVRTVWPSGTESAAAGTDVGGVKVAGATVSLAILDTTAPTNVTGLSVLKTSPDQVILSWDNSTDNVAVVNYEVWRDQVKIADVPVNGYVDNTASSASHQYQIIAVDAAGNRSSNSKSLTVSTADVTSPTTPTNLKLVTGDSGVTLSWTASTDDMGVLGYKIYRNGTLIGKADRTRFVDSSVAENTSYRYQVVAFDSSNNESALSSVAEVVSGDVTAPAAPKNLVAASVTDSTVQLTWDASTDNTGVTQYRIVRDGRLLALTSLTQYTDTDIQAGATYEYYVKALDAAKNISLASDAITVEIDGVCEADKQFYELKVSATLETCASCHTAQGIAGATNLILHENQSDPNSSSFNLSALQSSHAVLGADAILAKASGRVPHTGGSVIAEDSTAYADMSEFLMRLDTPESCNGEVSDSGADIPVASLAANCASCHGTEGASAGPATPTISGLDSSYLLKVMRDYQSGYRESTVMNRIAQAYTDHQLQALAKYFESQPHYVTASKDVNQGLVELGKSVHDTNCASCHAAGGRDSSTTGTRLAGQFKPYMRKTLQDYRASLSTAPSTMLQRLGALSDNEVEALVEYYASIQPDTTEPDAVDFLNVAATTADSVTLSWMDADDDWGVAYYEIYRDGVLVGISRFPVFTDSGLMGGNYVYTIVAVDVAGNKSVVSDALSVTISMDQMAADDVDLMNLASTLRKASIVLLGRLPTEEELASATTEEDLRVTMRNMFAGEALDDFVYRAGHEVFLSRGAARARSNEGIRTEDFPALGMLSGNERRAVDNDIKREPIFLMQHIVEQDKPWTDIVAADYTVLTPELVKALGAVPVDSNVDSDGLQVSRIPRLSARLGDKAFPHAGVLTTNAWLSRFPTTATNRNRHRSAMVFKQFLGVDIEALAQRPIDDSSNDEYKVPTMENPNCMVCHTVMEPIAGTFKNWGDRNRYYQNFNGERGDRDSLDRGYKSRDYQLNHDNRAWYHSGDTWYRDMFQPGFGDNVMPGGYKAFDQQAWDVSDNLLLNPGAEQDFDHWIIGTGTARILSGPRGCEGGPSINSGEKIFNPGSICENQSSLAIIYQEVDVSDWSDQIDSSVVKASFGAALRHWSRDNDEVSAYLNYYDADGNLLGTSESAFGEDYYWADVNLESSIPALTRTIRFNIQGRRIYEHHPNTDAFADDAYLKIQTPAGNLVIEDDATDSLQWLGSQLIKDPRFAKGSVYFWYKALFKRDPLLAPLDKSAMDYEQKLAAYNEQDAMIELLAKRLPNDQGSGAWNVKDLLIELVLSPMFRAEKVSAAADISSDSGLARILTPEELNRKVKALTGRDWRSFRSEDDRVWRDRMGLFYGGFDGGALQPAPNEQMNSMMTKVAERMAVELSCEAVRDDFRRNPSERLLFPYVADIDTPAYEEINKAQNNLLVNPGAEDDFNGWTIGTGTARILSGPRGCQGGPSIKSGEKIFNPGGICSNQSELGIIYQDVDVTNWTTQVDSGQVQVLFGAALRSWSRNNDEASAYLTYYDAQGNLLATSESLLGGDYNWVNKHSYATLPAQTRIVRFNLQGRRVNQSHPNNDSFADDAYLRLILPGTKSMTLGEEHIRSNLQYLHKQLLNEDLSVDSEEIDRSFNLFKEVWATDSVDGENSCRLYNSWEDPNRTKRAWSIILMYMMTDAKFLYE